MKRVFVDLRQVGDEHAVLVDVSRARRTVFKRDAEAHRAADWGGQFHRVRLGGRANDVVVSTGAQEYAFIAGRERVSAEDVCKLGAVYARWLALHRFDGHYQIAAMNGVEKIGGGGLDHLFRPVFVSRLESQNGNGGSVRRDVKPSPRRFGAEGVRNRRALYRVSIDTSEKADMLTPFPVRVVGRQNAFAHPLLDAVAFASLAVLETGIVESGLGGADVEDCVFADALRAAGARAVFSVGAGFENERVPLFARKPGRVEVGDGQASQLRFAQNFDDRPKRLDEFGLFLVFGGALGGAGVEQQPFGVEKARRMQLLSENHFHRAGVGVPRVGGILQDFARELVQRRLPETRRRRFPNDLHAAEGWRKIPIRITRIARGDALGGNPLAFFAILR